MPLDELIYQYRGLKIILPDQLGGIFEKIKGSEKLLANNPPNMLSYKTWKNAMNFLAEYSKYIHEEYRITLSSPIILEGEEGSINLFFKTKTKNNIMSINISKKEDKIIAFYFGQDYGSKDRIKESIQINENKIKIHKSLAKWMKNYLGE